MSEIKHHRWFKIVRREVHDVVLVDDAINSRTGLHNKYEQILGTFPVDDVDSVFTTIANSIAGRVLASSPRNPRFDLTEHREYLHLLTQKAKRRILRRVKATH